MCGRFAFYSPAEAAAALFGVDATVPSEPRYNIAPTQLGARDQVRRRSSTGNSSCCAGD